MYELDGNNDGPIDLGPVGKGEAAFLHAAVEHVKQAYIAPFPDSHFSLIALGPKRRCERGNGCKRGNTRKRWCVPNTRKRRCAMRFSPAARPW